MKLSTLIIVLVAVSLAASTPVKRRAKNSVSQKELHQEFAPIQSRAVTARSLLADGLIPQITGQSALDTQSRELTAALYGLIDNLDVAAHLFLNQPEGPKIRPEDAVRADEIPVAGQINENMIQKVPATPVQPSLTPSKVNGAQMNNIGQLAASATGQNSGFPQGIPEFPPANVVAGLFQQFLGRGVPKLGNVNGMSARAGSIDIGDSASKCTRYSVSCNPEAIRNSPLFVVQVDSALRGTIDEVASPGLSALTQSLGCWCQAGPNPAIGLLDHWLTCPGILNLPIFSLNYIQENIPIPGCQCVPRCEPKP